MPVRPALALAFLILIASGMAASARQLAVGAAAGYFEPPGYRAVPVYTYPNGGRWSPVDTSLGYRFREPIYSTPRGYRYVYVRGYYWKRIANPYVRPVYRRVAVKRYGVRKARRGGPCVTDMGFGRHELCRRLY